MESQRINSLICSVLLEIKKNGLKDSTVEVYSRYLKRLSLFFEENNEIFYSKPVLESFVGQISKDFKSQAITLRYYNALKRGAYLVRDYAETGSIKWKVYADTRKFKPNIHYTEYIEATLSSSDLKPEFLYKLNYTLRKFCCFMEENGVYSFEQVTSQCVKNFVLSVKNTNYGSVYYILYSLRLLFKYLHQNGIIPELINLDYYHMKNPPQKLIPPYTHEEINQVIQKIDQDSDIGKRDYAIILLTLNTGLRGIDVRRLKLQDIDWYGNALNIIQSKTGRTLKLPLKGSVCNALADYILHARPKTSVQNVFVRSVAPFDPFITTASLDVIIERYCLKAGVSKKHLRSFHSLRRSFGTWMSEREVPIHTISQILGHADMNSSKPYLSFNQQQMSACAMGFENIPISGGVFA